MVMRRVIYLILLIVLACSKDKDEDPVPTCTVGSSVLSGSTSQVVNAGSPITNIIYQLNSPNCAGSFASINASGLPPGVSASLDSINDRITLSGTPSSQTSGTYNYSVSFEKSNNG